MKKQVTIVRSAVSSLPSAGIINLLRENGFRIAGMDLTDKSAGRHLVDSFHLVSRSSESTRDKVIREIIAIAGMEKADWIISGPENEIALLASAEDQFTAMGCFLFHPVAETLRIVTDKAKLNIFLSENNFPVMPFAYKGSVIPGFGPGELVFKPSKGRGSSGVKFIRNTKEEISAVLSEAGEEEFILQPRLKGKEYTVDVLCDMSGRVTDIVPRERIAVESGISVASKTVKNESLT
ncbi:MAG TPA: ATP-grasp domain-containing protein, partial [Bacteroidia bacterium]|nr:ATP-grasp domain-containing protein [Bacteroidia bacterium]